ncbi:MAG: hypothetical protein EOP23_17460 [Hyphomicrobiales bacterium]|nr:MAG: hypothetical protein EOP23_17460 [Hyphomicrobiales bacterium]
MKTTTAASLADIELDLPIRAVVDDLAGFADRLSLFAGPEQGYAAFAAETFQVDDIADRAAGHAGEVMRFLALAGTSGPMQVAFFFDMLIGLSFLNAASTIAVALVPPRPPRDFAARRRVLGDVIAAVGGDADFVEAARKAFAHGDLSGPAEVETVFHATTAFSIDDMRDDQPTVLGLEQGLSLMAFVRELASPAVLVERAALQLDDTARFARTIEEQADLDRERLDRLQRAAHGANLLAAADLARACLIDAVADDDNSVKGRVEDQAARLIDQRLRDIVMFAGTMAERLRELRRMQRQVGDRYESL